MLVFCKKTTVVVLGDKSCKYQTDCSGQRGQKEGKSEGRFYIINVCLLLIELIIFYTIKHNYSFITMSESLKRSHDGDSDDSSDGWIGPMPSEAAKPMKRKCKSLY
jgi:hypothetical protein